MTDKEKIEKLTTALRVLAYNRIVNVIEGLIAVDARTEGAEDALQYARKVLREVVSDDSE